MMPKLSSRPWRSIAFAAAIVLPFIGTTPAFADAASAAAFVQTTCLANSDDITRLEAIAKEKGWKPVTDVSAPDQGGMQLKSMYEVAQGNEKFVVVAGSAKWQHTGGLANLCMVMFVGEKVNQPEMFKLLSTGLELKTVV